MQGIELPFFFTPLQVLNQVHPQYRLTLIHYIVAYVIHSMASVITLTL
jgi:hypothetical protein